ncbi:POK18 protein, partial [Sapayoa aenigma]|nr:POK18 protein [Sapayoa aenigma]
PWKYLGWTITQAHIRPQKLKINTKVQTSNDVQRLLGDLQWLRPIVGFQNEDLEIL